MKRILFINGHLNTGGCERSLVDLLKHFDYDKYQVDLLLLEEMGDYLNEIPKEVNILLYSLNKAFGPFAKCIIDSVKDHDWFSLRFRMIHLISSRFGKQYLKYARKLFPGLRVAYDTVVAYRPGICTDFAAYVVAADHKISWWHHGEYTYTKQQAEIINQAYLKMDHIVAVSNSSANIIREHFPDNIGKIKVIPNMICTEDLIGKSEESCCITWPEDGIFKIISVGRLSPEKNMVICPEVGKTLSEHGLRYKWFIVGDGPDKSKLQELITQNRLGDFFVLTGRLANPYPEMEKADILVHPSIVESQGLTVLEAMALNKPVVVVKSDGPKEYVKNNVNGLLVENDAADIAEAILLLEQDQAMRERFADEAKKVIDAFSPAKVISMIEKII